jgi:tRNA G26 N,N-dimethylase Trm1
VYSTYNTIIVVVVAAAAAATRIAIYPVIFSLAIQEQYYFSLFGLFEAEPLESERRGRITCGRGCVRHETIIIHRPEARSTQSCPCCFQSFGNLHRTS